MAELGRIPTNSSVLGSVQLTKGQKKRDFLYAKKLKKKLQAVIFFVQNYLGGAFYLKMREVCANRR